MPQQQVAQTPSQPPEALPQPQPLRPAKLEQEPRQQSEVREPDPPVPNPLPQMPSDDKLLILINSALVALNQANATGNYTVLWDMAAPGFKRANSPERLSQVFSNLRKRNLDLSPILLFQPKLYQRPAINNKGMLRITGFFPTSPGTGQFRPDLPARAREVAFVRYCGEHPEGAASASCSPGRASPGS